jgi:predicted TIM-barrel fold metal-dependent hydrolase
LYVQAKSHRTGNRHDVAQHAHADRPSRWTSDKRLCHLARVVLLTARKVIDELFVNVPEEERRKIIADNAVRFWNLGS